MLKNQKFQPPKLVRERSRSADLTSGDPQQICDNYKLIKNIRKSRFPVYLAKSLEDNKTYILKAFPFKEDTINPAYLNELRFSSIAHKNVISIIAGHGHSKLILDGKSISTSNIVMEYAPHGDFIEVFNKKIIKGDEILIRTYFHQLINGLREIHSHGYAHMDLKLENLLLGDDYLLKIIDFDLSCIIKGSLGTGKGTKNFRAPELKARECTDFEAADVYSAGVILFCFMTGSLPYMEDVKFDDCDLQELILDNNPLFWEVHPNLQEGDLDLSEDFKKLFMSMIRRDPSKRITIKDIMRNKWYNGPTYSDTKLKNIMEFKMAFLKSKAASMTAF